MEDSNMAKALMTKAKAKTPLSEAEKVRIRTRRTRRFKQFFPLYLMMILGLVYLLINNYLPWPDW